MTEFEQQVEDALKALVAPMFDGPCDQMLDRLAPRVAAAIDAAWQFERRQFESRLRAAHAPLLTHGRVRAAALAALRGDT